MAGLKRPASQVWPEEHGEQEHGLYGLHRMFVIVGTHLTHRDVRVLSFLFVDVIDDHERGLIRNGRDFLLALERQGRCDESNFRQVLQVLRIITRHDLLPYVTLKRRRAVCPDLVDKYLEETSIRYVTPRALSDPEPRPPQPPKTVPPHYPVVCCPTSGPQMCSKRPARGRATLGSQRKRRKSVTPDPKEKQTCGEEVQGFQRWSRLEGKYEELLGYGVVFCFSTSGCGFGLNTASTRLLCRATSSLTSRTHLSASLSALTRPTPSSSPGTWAPSSVTSSSLS
ncbi:death effector domain-containing protein isoform X3 [Carlito syrichta]|uniref:Death effector domain-containing protein n=1 Tax=Carlito syrichta TaxID=1868482 RepID=A0A3Q0E7K4_CARSF|nr:death effector domain-containing protein isoform X3 [Carlito syrichta]